MGTAYKMYLLPEALCWSFSLLKSCIRIQFLICLPTSSTCCMQQILTFFVCCFFVHSRVGILEILKTTQDYREKTIFFCVSCVLILCVRCARMNRVLFVFINFLVLILTLVWCIFIVISFVNLSINLLHLRSFCFCNFYIGEVWNKSPVYSTELWRWGRRSI